MIRFYYLLLVTVLCTINKIECSKIQDVLPGYYNSDTVKRFEEEWSKYRRAFENAIGTGLQQEFGRSSVNIFEERRPISHLLARGFSLSDGVVNVYFLDMVLRELPLLVRPELKMSLSNNHQSIFARVGRMFIDAAYYVARNKSSEVYAHPKDQKNMSPFSLQQVDRFGKVAITAEDCLLSGSSVVSLSGDSVNLGHTMASVYNCKFTVEISTPHSGAPPVIAPYFPKGPKEKLELILTAPIVSELQTKLQGALYSYVNTSVLFGQQGSEFRKKQQDLFKNYAKFIRNYVFKVNQNTLKANRGVVQLPNYAVRIDSPFVDESSSSCTVGLKDLKLYGLETAYVGRSGGPYKDNSPDTAADVIIFSSLQMRGRVTHNDGNGSKVYDFAAELTDITVDIEIKIKGSKTEILQMQMTGWRSLAFGIIPWQTLYNDRISYQSLVYGYILNELPTQVIKHLTSILGSIANDGNNKFEGGSGGPGDGGSGGDTGDGGGDSSKPLYDGNDGKKPGGKKEFFTDDNLDKNFFTDDNLEKDFFTDDNLEKDFFTDDNIKKDFFSDDHIKKDFFTDDNIKKDFFTDDNIKKDFFTDDNIKKDFFTDDNIKKDFFTDDNIKKDFFTDDHIKKDFFTDGDIRVTDDNGGVTGETDNNTGLTGREYKTDDYAEELGDDRVTDDNGGLTGKEFKTNNNGGLTGREYKTDDDKVLTGSEDETDDIGGLTGREYKTDDDKVLTSSEDETDDIGGLTSREYKTDDKGGLTGREFKTDDIGGLTGREYKTDDNKGLTGREFKNDDYAEGLGDDKDTLSHLTDGFSKGFDDDNEKPFLDENFFSDFESRRLVTKDNDTANIQIPKQRENYNKKDHSNGNKRSSIGSGKATDEENINQNVKNNSRTVQKPALPPNVHNMRRLNNPRMSENEIR